MYIGSKPADKVLTASDITDGVVSTAKIADNAVTADKTSYKDVPYRNILINGDISVAQRGTSQSSLSTGFNTVDRFEILKSADSAFTESQSTDVPTGQGFANSWKIECTTADASLNATDYLIWRQPIEAQNLQYLKFGTASAESITLSFWIKSSKTGTYIISLRNADNDRLIAQSYTVSSADTWEKKELTFAGDTSSGFNNDNGEGLRVQFQLLAGSNYSSGTLQTTWGTYANANSAVGQVNFGDNTSNELYITGVQLEIGTSASDFEFLPYDVNLKRCYRYYFKHSLGDVGGYGKRAGISTTFAILESSFYTVPMRAAASMSSGTPTFLNCSTLTLNSFDGGKSYMCRVTSSNSNEYRAYETTVEHNAEL